MKYIKEITRNLNSAFEKIVGWKKKYANPKRSWKGKTLIAEVSHLMLTTVKNESR